MPKRMDKLDKKFEGVIVKTKNGVVVPGDQYMVFLAKDDAFPPTLAFYYEQCVKLGADARQLEAVKNAMVRVDMWRAANPELCKRPDVEPGEIAELE